jgi:hypothetical protein
MTNNTNSLIENLSKDLQPVHPLESPAMRTVRWLAILLPYALLAVWLLHTVGKLPVPEFDFRFVLEQVFALMTGLAAAMAAFASVVPGRNRSYLLWPLAPMIGWMATLGEGCFHNASEGISLHHNLLCFPFILILGTPPAIVLWTMLRRGAPLAPSTTVALAALAAAGVGNFCVRLVHAEDVSLMLVVWHVGGMLLLTLLTAGAGNRLLNWGSITQKF